MITQIFKDSIKGKIANFRATWYPTKDFSKISPITQVYGICFDKDGKIVVVSLERKKWQLPGGTPEKNETPEQTLMREVDEEADLDLKNIQPLGYQKIENLDTNEIQYQLRYFALIAKIKPQTIDQAVGKILVREFIEPKDFSKYCPWGNVGEEVIRLGEEAFRVSLSKRKEMGEE